MFKETTTPNLKKILMVVKTSIELAMTVVSAPLRTEAPIRLRASLMLL